MHKESGLGSFLPNHPNQNRNNRLSLPSFTASASTLPLTSKLHRGHSLVLCCILSGNRVTIVLLCCILSGNRATIVLLCCILSGNRATIVLLCCILSGDRAKIVHFAVFYQPTEQQLSLFAVQAILPIEQSIPRSTYIHPPAVNAAKGAF